MLCIPFLVGGLPALAMWSMRSSDTNLLYHTHSYQLSFDATCLCAGLSQPLKLNPAVLGGIFQCTITRWDDPALRAINADIR